MICINCYVFHSVYTGTCTYNVAIWNQESSVGACAYKCINTSGLYLPFPFQKKTTKGICLWISWKQVSSQEGLSKVTSMSIKTMPARKLLSKRKGNHDFFMYGYGKNDSLFLKIVFANKSDNTTGMIIDYFSIFQHSA